MKKVTNFATVGVKVGRKVKSTSPSVSSVLRVPWFPLEPVCLRALRPGSQTPDSSDSPCPSCPFVLSAFSLAALVALPPASQQVRRPPPAPSPPPLAVRHVSRPRLWTPGAGLRQSSS